MYKFPHANLSHLTAIASYHNNQILLNIYLNVPTGPKPFKFESMWLQDDSCFDIVHNASNYFVKRYPHFRISSRIRIVKVALKDWNYSYFGNLQSHIKMLSDEISCLQQSNQSSSNLEPEKNL